MEVTSHDTTRPCCWTYNIDTDTNTNTNIDAHANTKENMPSGAICHGAMCPLVLYARCLDNSRGNMFQPTCSATPQKRK